ncbi:MAG: putative membrane protein [Halioglobus sp.]
MLKVVIVLLLLGLIASLGSGFYYLMIDQGDKTKRRTLHSLGVRVSLAAALIAVVAYGVSTGQLGHRAPWDPVPASTQPPK